METLCTLSPGLCCSYNPQFVGPYSNPLPGINVNIYEVGSSTPLYSGSTDSNGLFQPAITLIMGQTYTFTTTSSVLPSGSFVAPIPRALANVTMPPVFATLNGQPLISVDDDTVTAYVSLPPVVQVNQALTLSLIRSFLIVGPWQIVTTIDVDQTARYMALTDTNPALGRTVYYSAFITDTSGAPGIMAQPVTFTGAP